MGVVWELLDLKNQRRFGLDKGGWYSLHHASSGDVIGPLTLDEVQDACLKARRTGNTSDCRNLAARLWAFCEVAEWDVMTMNDHGDYPDDAMMVWPVVDERCRSTGDVMDEDPCEAETLVALIKAGAFDVSSEVRATGLSAADMDGLGAMGRAALDAVSRHDHVPYDKAIRAALVEQAMTGTVTSSSSSSV